MTGFLGRVAVRLPADRPLHPGLAGLAHKLAAALGGQTTLVPDPAVAALAARARLTRGRPHRMPGTGDDVVAIHTDQVRVEDVREAGPVHVGHHLWHALTLDPILAAAGLSARARRLTEVMTRSTGW